LARVFAFVVVEVSWTTAWVSGIAAVEAVWARGSKMIPPFNGIRPPFALVASDIPVSFTVRVVVPAPAKIWLLVVESRAVELAFRIMLSPP
jgi:hypothetical protein